MVRAVRRRAQGVALILGGVCKRCGVATSKGGNLCRTCWRAAVARSRVRAVCPWCQIEAARGDRGPSEVTKVITRSRWRASRLHFCSRSHERRYFNERQGRCAGCGRPFTIHPGGRERFHDRSCYAAWKAANSEAALRLRAAWNEGVRGVRPLARAAEVSTHTVTRFMERESLAERGA